MALPAIIEKHDVLLGGLTAACVFIAAAAQNYAEGKGWLKTGDAT